MSRLTIPIAIVCVAVVAVTSLSKSHSLARPVEIRVFDAEGSGKAVMGPKLVVLVCNFSQQRLFIRRGINVVDNYSFRPLRATVISLRTGRHADGRRIYKRLQVNPTAADFVGIESDCCYGAIVDLRDDFDLERGARYSVQFTYFAPSPTMVGGVRPWQGLAQSRKITVLIP